jgi:methylenetetrahydrofolate dehydrogenase (NAD+)
VTGVPTKNYRLPTEWIQENTTVINVASFKNVDEESLLKIPGVVYVPLVGKVTVAMLERNLMRLYENFHSPDAIQQPVLQQVAKEANQSWWLHAYTAAVVSLILVNQMVSRK